MLTYRHLVSRSMQPRLATTHGYEENLGYEIGKCMWIRQKGWDHHWNRKRWDWKKASAGDDPDWPSKTKRSWAPGKKYQKPPKKRIMKRRLYRSKRKRAILEKTMGGRSQNPTAEERGTWEKKPTPASQKAPSAKTSSRTRQLHSI